MDTIPPSQRSGVYNTRNILLIAILAASYLLLSYLLTGSLRADHFTLVLLFCVLYFLTAGTRKFILAFSIFIVYWMIFDYMKAFPNYRFATVHIQSLYEDEKNIFGFIYQGRRITPNEYFLINHNPILDFLSGLFYLNWIPLPLIFGVFLFYKKRPYFFYFSMAFFLINLIGFIIYYTYPAAPPWYVQHYGFVFHANTHGSTAGLSRFDQLFHIHLFSAIYSKSSNVFAAMPSLHCAYPMLVLYYGIKTKTGIVNLLFAFIMVGIWFSAVYSSHHYVLDVLAGIACGLCGMLLFEWLIRKSKALNDFVDFMVRICS